MKLNLGDKVIWEDYDQTKLQLRGIVGRIIGDDIVIYWDNGRKIQYTPDMLIELESRYGANIKLDAQSIRQEKLEILGI